MIQSFSILPSEPLRPYVHHYWVMRTDGEEVCEDIFPPTCMKWVFHREVPFSINGIEDSARNAAICLQYDRTVQVQSSSRLEMICVFFHPYATKFIMRMPAMDLAGHLIGLDEIDDTELAQLKHRVHSADSNDEAIMLIESFLYDRISQQSGNPYLKQLSFAFSTLQANPTIHLQELASAACLSERQFRTVFTENVGIAPKQLMRLNRFKYIINRLICNPALHLEEALFAGDLTDYSHLNKEFHHFANMTPREFLDNLRMIREGQLMDTYQSYYNCR